MNCNVHKTEYPVTVRDAWWMCRAIVYHVNLSEISTVACYTADTWMRGWSLGWNLWPSCHTHLSTLVAASSHAGLPLWIWDLMRWIQDLHQMGPNVVRGRYAKFLYDSTLPQQAVNFTKSEDSGNIYVMTGNSLHLTWCDTPEDLNLQPNHCCENLNSHITEYN